MPQIDSFRCNPELQAEMIDNKMDTLELRQLYFSNVSLVGMQD